MTTIRSTVRAPRVWVRGGADAVVEYLSGLAALAGVSARSLPGGGAARSGEPVLEVISEPDSDRSPAADLGSTVLAHVELVWEGFERRFVLPREDEELLAVLAGARAPLRSRLVVVTSLSGGVGSSSLAVVLARELAAAGMATAVLDLHPDGVPLASVAVVEPESGLRWADVVSDGGTVIPDRLISGLPVWQGVRVLSADDRGGVEMAPDGGAAVVRAALQACDVVIVDAPRRIGVSGLGLGVGVPPPDAVVVVGRADSDGVAAARRARRHVAEVAELSAVMLAVRVSSAGAVTPDDVAEAAGVPEVLPVRLERGLAAGRERGVPPGDRRQGGLRSAARRVVAWLDLS